MKKKAVSLLIMGIMIVSLVSCGTKKVEETVQDQSNNEKTTETTEINYKSIDYSNVFFEENISDELKSEEFTTPKSDLTAKIKEETGISIVDSNGATGVELVSSIDENNKSDLYINTFIVGSNLNISVDAADGEEVTVSNNNADGTVDSISNENGLYKVELEGIDINTDVEETISIKIGDKTYTINTIHEMLPNIDTYSNGNAEEGIYTLALDKFLLRVNTKGQIVYYRDMGWVCKNLGEELQVENFKAQDTEDGRYYSFFVELDPSKRNANGGFSAGEYVVMDENYKEINYVTLQENSDSNHKHGEGYLDQHEFVMLSKDHWLSLSYTEEEVENLPEALNVDKAYVQAGIVQEVKDGKVISEYNTTDYPFLYETAKENIDYAASKPNGTADDYMDYVHVNSINIDPKDNNIIVSMRSQYSVYKIDRETGEIIWVLGGDKDEFGLTEEQKFLGQHYAMYVDSKLADGNDSVITIFDNNTDFQENKTRILEIKLDEINKKIVDYKQYIGEEMNNLSAEIGKTEANHWSTHCGSSEIQSSDSMIIGWGLHGALSGDGNIPVLSDYNKSNNSMNFELYATRNEKCTYHERFFSYRIYKNAF